MVAVGIELVVGEKKTSIQELKINLHNTLCLTTPVMITKKKYYIGSSIVSLC